MAFYIRIEKISETEGEAIFRFYDTAYPTEIGELRLNKRNAEISLLKASRETFFLRASRKVSVAHQSGSLPELLEWAS